MKLKILFLSANPHQDLKPDEEYRIIESVVKNKSVEFTSKFAVRINDLIHAINEKKPHIIHFTGHGTDKGELRLTDSSGNMDELLTAESLAKLFSTVHRANLVFLSACHSLIQAKAIIPYVDCVIGMNRQINDTTAIAFSETFYDAFLFEKSIEEAFKQAIVRLETEFKSEKDIPELIVKQDDNKNIKISDILIDEIPLYNNHNKIDYYIIKKELDKQSNFFKIKKKREINKTVPTILTPMHGYNTVINPIGYDNQIDVIDKLLNKYSILLIQGIPKIGKTLLSSYYLKNRKELFEHYGYVLIKENFKEDFTNSFLDSLKLRKFLLDNDSKVDRIFDMLIHKLHNLVGNKLLVIDIESNVNYVYEDIKPLFTLKDSNYKILFAYRNKIKDIETYQLLPLSPKNSKELFLKNISTNIQTQKIDELIKYLDYHPYFLEITSNMIEEGYNLDEILTLFKEDSFCQIEYFDDKEKRVSFYDILKKIILIDSLGEKELLLLEKISDITKKNTCFNNFQEFEKFQRFLDISELQKLLKVKLNSLSEKGFILKKDNQYRIPKIVSEFILENKKRQNNHE